VGVEAHQLLSDDGAAIRILPRHAVGLEYLQKVAQRSLQFMARTTDRIGAGARRQVLREKAHDGALPDRFQVVPFLCQPMAEVLYAAHIDAPGARRISPTLQVLPVLRNVGPKNAGLRPRAGPWLNDDLSSHADLLPSCVEGDHDYAYSRALRLSVIPLIRRGTCSACTRELRIITGCA